MQRFGQVIGIKPEHVEEYERLHAAVWPEVLATIRACNIRDYTIFRQEDMLFAYFVYVGDDFEGDMEKMASDPKTQEWWTVCKPMQEPWPSRMADEWWATMKEVFHAD